MKVSIALALACFLASLASVQCSPVEKNGVLANEFSAVASRRAAAKSASSKSPLLEIVFRILDTIQIVSKRRSRRHARSLTRPSPLFRRTLFSGRVKQPLMELSLESSETAPFIEEGPWDGVEEEEEEEEEAEDTDELWGGHDFHRSNDQLLRYVSTTSERFYDMVLGVLQVLEGHARQEVQRARLQLEAGQRDATGSDDEPPT